MHTLTFGASQRSDDLLAFHLGSSKNKALGIKKKRKKSPNNHNSKTDMRQNSKRDFQAQ